MRPKIWYRSRTLIFNAGCAVAAVLPELQDALPLLHGLLPAGFHGQLSLVVVLGNVLLRGITRQPLCLSPQQAER